MIERKVGRGAWEPEVWETCSFARVHPDKHRGAIKNTPYLVWSEREMNMLCFERWLVKIGKYKDDMPWEDTRVSHYETVQR